MNNRSLYFDGVTSVTIAEEIGMSALIITSLVLNLLILLHV